MHFRHSETCGTFIAISEVKTSMIFLEVPVPHGSWPLSEATGKYFQGVTRCRRILAPGRPLHSKLCIRSLLEDIDDMFSK